MNNELEFAKTLAHDAGEIMRKHFNNTTTHYKSDNTPVTLADTEINQLVIDRVRAEYPDHGVYSEEASFDQENSTVWVCDPLDGTSSFARGIPVAVFSLALVLDGTPQLGVIYDPWTDRLYFAAKTHGAYLNNQQIHVNQHTLSDREAVIGYDYSPTMSFNTLKAAYELSRKTRFSGLGSFVHGSALVASGMSVAYIASGNRPYDIAAAKIIVEEAGGRVTDIFGEDQRYDREVRGAVVSNGIIHDEIINTIKKEFI